MSKTPENKILVPMTARQATIIANALDVLSTAFSGAHVLTHDALKQWADTKREIDSLRSEINEKRMALVAVRNRSFSTGGDDA